MTDHLQKWIDSNAGLIRAHHKPTAGAVVLAWNGTDYEVMGFSTGHLVPEMRRISDWTNCCCILVPGGEDYDLVQIGMSKDAGGRTQSEVESKLHIDQPLPIPYSQETGSGLQPIDPKPFRGFRPLPKQKGYVKAGSYKEFMRKARAREKKRARKEAAKRKMVDPGSGEDLGTPE